MTEFFLPLAYSVGWRIAAEADRLWNAFDSLRRRSGRRTVGVGMKWINDAARMFLFSSMVCDSIHFTADDKMWLNCAVGSKYEDSLS